jgi:hypothetical protein
VLDRKVSTHFLHSLPAVPFSPVHIIPPTLHTQLHLHVTLTRRTSGRSPGTFHKRCFSEILEQLIKKYCHLHFIKVSFLFQYLSLYYIVFIHQFHISMWPCFRLPCSYTAKHVWFPDHTADGAGCGRSITTETHIHILTQLYTFNCSFTTTTFSPEQHNRSRLQFARPTQSREVRHFSTLHQQQALSNLPKTHPYTHSTGCTWTAFNNTNAPYFTCWYTSWILSVLTVHNIHCIATGSTADTALVTMIL